MGQQVAYEGFRLLHSKLEYMECGFSIKRDSSEGAVVLTSVDP